MKVSYYIDEVDSNNFWVWRKTIIPGERLSAYESGPDKVKTEKIYYGSPADCLAIIKLLESGYLKK